MQGVKCTREIESSITMTISAFNKQKALLFIKLDFILKNKLINFYVCSRDLYNA